MLDAARKAGAEIWRGATVREVRPGKPPAVLVARDGRNKVRRRTRCASAHFRCSPQSRIESRITLLAVSTCPAAKRSGDAFSARYRPRAEVRAVACYSAHASAVPLPQAATHPLRDRQSSACRTDLGYLHRCLDEFR